MASWLEKLRDFFSDDLYQPEQQKLVEKKQKTKKLRQEKNISKKQGI